MKTFLYVRKGFLTALGTALFGLLMAGTPKLAKLAFGLVLTDKEVLTIRLVLGLFGFLLLVIAACIHYSRLRRTLNNTAKRLYDAEHPSKPHHPLDDYTFERLWGLYRRNGEHRAGFFCGKCLPSGTVSHVQELTDPPGYQCRVCGEFFAHPTRKPNTPPSPPANFLDRNKDL